MATCIKRPAACLAALILLGLVLSLSGCEKSPAPSKLSIRMHSAPEDASTVNSVLVSGEREAILFDTQMAKDQAAQVVEMIRNSGKTLTTVVISHPHPDHLMGAAVIRAAFPDARFVAAANVAKLIESGGEALRQRMLQRLGDRIADSVVVPEPLADDSLYLEGIEIRLITMKPGESEAAIVAFIPSLKALIANDVVYNGVHLWLREGRFDGWRQNLATLDGLGEIETIYPGHGAAGGPELIGWTRQYIDDFLAEADRAQSAEGTIESMRAKYPANKCGYCLKFAAQARFSQQ